MSEISADANPLLVAFRGRAIGSRVMITELDSIVDVIANRLNALPSTVNMAESGPSEIAQLLDIAVSAAEQIDQRFVRETINLPLLSVQGYFIRQSAVGALPGL